MALITSTDVEKALMLAVLAPVAWLTPESAWWPVSEAVAAASGRLLSTRRRWEAQRLPPFLARLEGRTRQEAATRVVAGANYEALATLREYRPGGWQPRIEITGREKLDAALQDGRGAILWVGEFILASLVVKMALGRAGYRVSHLSRPDHGFSGSRFGQRFLNPVETRVEERYAERIVLPPGEGFGSLRQLRRRLQAGGIVSITVGQNAAQTLTVPFIEGGLRLAKGPVNLARSSGAPLLPVFTLRHAPGSYEVRIEGPLTRSGGREDETPFRKYAALLAEYVRRTPDTWRGWQTGGWVEEAGT